MLLANVLDLLVSERPISKATSDQYRRAVRRFEEYLGKSPAIEDLTTESVNSYLTWLESKKHLGAISVRNHRIGLLAVWNYAVYPLGVAPQYVARRIRNPHCLPHPVHAWTVADVRVLIEAARGLPGKLKCGLPCCLVAELWVRLGVETGLRPSDLRSIRWWSVDLDNRRIAINQHKTGGVIVCGFSSATMGLLEQIRQYAFEIVLPVTKTVMHRLERKLYRAAARQGFVKRKREGLGMLRKTHATEVYRKHGLSAAAESLGHRSGEKIARDHYVDSSVAKVYVVDVV